MPLLCILYVFIDICIVYMICYLPGLINITASRAPGLLYSYALNKGPGLSQLSKCLTSA